MSFRPQVQHDELDPVFQREFYDMPFMEVPDTGGLLIGCLNIFHIISAWVRWSLPTQTKSFAFFKPHNSH